MRHYTNERPGVKMRLIRVDYLAMRHSVDREQR